MKTLCGAQKGACCPRVGLIPPRYFTAYAALFGSKRLHQRVSPRTGSEQRQLSEYGDGVNRLPGVNYPELRSR